MSKPTLETLQGCKTDEIPFWFMRQAGRYLPEYRDLRAKSGGFLDMVYNPERASEVTLQPIRRFGMNGAILFSDILVIPQALGQDLRFEAGEGPKLDVISDVESIKKLNLDNIHQTLFPIYETIKLTKEKLEKENFNQTTLIGFAGSPWTVACYMVEGGGSKNFEAIKQWAYKNPDDFQKLIDVVTDATVQYLYKQVEAGVEAIQLFDSWAGILDKENFMRWIIQSTTKIITEFKNQYPDIPVIGFPRQAGHMINDYIENTGIQAVGLDYTVSVKWANDNISSNIILQGNMDPVHLLAGGISMERAANEVLETFSGRNFIFNLGHGVIKETPVKHVEQLCRIIQDFKR